MRKLIFMILLCVSIQSQASVIGSILNVMRTVEAMETGQLDAQRGILSTQRDIRGLMRDLNANTSGHFGQGEGYKDYQSYGSNAADWSEVLRMASRGHGDNALGEAIYNAAKEFPRDEATYNRGISQARSQRYYAKKSETILAVRAASQVDYDKIEKQINYQKKLLKKVDNTDNLKAAMDLSNRLQIESNLISLQILRQSALANQQQAIVGQADINTALSNARFLIKE